MDRKSKSFAIILIFLMTFSSLSLLMVGSASAQTGQTPNYSDYIPIPTTPEFTLNLVLSAYNKTVIDPGTGIKTTVNNSTIEVIIKNQQFSPYNYSWTFLGYRNTVENGSTSLGYDVQAKTHFSQNWTDVYFSGNYPSQSNSSDYTVLSLPQGPSVVIQFKGGEIIDPTYPSGNQIPSGSQLDFRVRAIISGWFPPVQNSDINFPLNFISKNSSWSNTQTITISPSSSSTSPPNIQWQKLIGSGSTESVSNLIQTTDGGYAFLDCGKSYQQHDFIPSTLFKLDSSGNMQWNKTIKLFTASNLIQTSDGGYEVAGEWNTYGIIYPTTEPLNQTTPALIKLNSKEIYNGMRIQARF